MVHHRRKPGRMHYGTGSTRERPDDRGSPSSELDVLVSDAEFDIVAAGFDAGVRLGEVIERDMIAVPVGKDQRQIVVAAPAYLAAAGTPLHPRELTRHRCIGWRSSVEAAPYRWEFTEDGRDFAVAVEPEMTTNEMALMVKMARAGAGLTIAWPKPLRRCSKPGSYTRCSNPIARCCLASSCSIRAVAICRRRCARWWITCEIGATDASDDCPAIPFALPTTEGPAREQGHSREGTWTRRRPATPRDVLLSRNPFPIDFSRNRPWYMERWES